MVSIIVPVYNTEKYLSRCIESILQQQYSDLELILIDDGTKDNAGKICDEYAQKDCRIKVLHKDNQGLAMARKSGLELAKGEYVLFVDSDDWIEKCMVSIMLEEAIQSNADVVCAQLQKVNDEGRIVEKSKKFEQVLCESTEKMVYHMHVSRYLSSTACAKMIRKELLEDVVFLNNLAIGEEHDMVVKIIMRAKKIIILDARFYNYYVRSGSISRSGFNEKYINSLELYMNIEENLVNMFPQYKQDIRSFYTEYEMAVVTAMCRNKTYNWEIINILRRKIKSHIVDICACRNMAIYLKCSAVLIAYFPHFFLIAFRILHLLTGR